MSIPAKRAPLTVLAALAVGAAACAANAQEAAENAPAEGAEVRTALHAQSTFITQSALPFRAKFKGDNSLANGGETKETWTVTPAAGLRLWPGSEFYFNPELFQGFGLDSTHGIAGFTNGEAQKGGTHIPKAYVARLLMRQVWGLGGERETVKDDFNQLGGTRDVSRLTLTVGKMSVSDMFDNNSLSHDPRDDFFNWSIWEAGGFDNAANTKGYTWGGALELNQKNWAVRAGYFLEPVVSNSDILDTRYFERGQYLAEIEQRYKLIGQPGTVRLLGWLSRVNASSFAEALTLTAATGTNINDATTAVHKVHTKYGFVAGIEQKLNDDIGVFARLSASDGRYETMSFTDVDHSASLGVVVTGAKWGRPNDKFGIAGAINGISGVHQNWFNAGGLGLLIGDGKLGYAPEQIAEGYYTYSFSEHLSLTLDGQAINNPAYNADRGPVEVLSARLHGHF